MKCFIAGLLLALCGPVMALDYEVSIGNTQFTPTPNGIWWQNGFAHQLDMNSQSYSLGITDRFNNGLRWRAAYTRLGNTYSNTMAVSDANYNGVDGCRQPCTETPWAVKGEGSIRGYSFTLAPEIYLGYGFKGFLEGGLFLFLPKFMASCGRTMSGPMYDCIEWNNGWQVGPQIGVGIEYSKTQLVWTTYRVDAPEPRPDYIPNWMGWAMNVSLRQRF
jgi:hypothetical protein